MVESKAGLPQLDLTLYPGQLFWLAVSFGLLYFLVSRVAVPSIRSAQYKRQAKLQGDLADAAAANQKAEALRIGYEESLNAARAKASAALSEAAAAAAKDAMDRKEKHQQAMDRRLRDAETRIAAARERALAEVKSVAEDLAAVLVEKVASLNPSQNAETHR